MSLQEKIAFLEEIMDLDNGELEETTVLEDIEEWDSLSRLSLTAMMKKNYHIDLTTEILSSFKTVKDICDIIPD